MTHALQSFAEHSHLFLDIIFIYIYILHLVPNSNFLIGATNYRPTKSPCD